MALRACAEHEDTTFARRARSASDQFDRTESARIDWIGRRLIARVPPHMGIRPEPCAQGDDPFSQVAELQETARGVIWLLARWEELLRVLEEERYWDVDRKHVAIRLLGRRPEDVFDDPFVSTIFCCAFAVTPEPKRLWSDVYDATVIDPLYPQDLRRVSDLSRRVPDATNGLRILKELVRTEMSRLQERKAELLPEQAADRRGAAARRCSTTPRRWRCCCATRRPPAAT